MNAEENSDTKSEAQVPNVDTESQKKKKRSLSSENGSPKRKKRKTEKHKKKKRESSSESVSSDTNSSLSTSSSSTKEKRKKRKKKKNKKEKKKKVKREKRKRRKEKKRKKKQSNDEEIIGPVLLDDAVKTSPSVDMTTCRSMAPMTKEEWEKKQSIVRRVFDEETGRYRLIKGDGEVLEEIVSKERHREINRQATVGDGAFFQAKLGTLQPK